MGCTIRPQLALDLCQPICIQSQLRHVEGDLLAQAEHQLLIQLGLECEARYIIYLLHTLHNRPGQCGMRGAAQCKPARLIPQYAVLSCISRRGATVHIGYLKLSGLGAGPRLADLMRLPGDGSRAFWKFFSIAINVCRPGLYRFCILRLEPIVLCLLVSVRSWLHSTRPEILELVHCSNCFDVYTKRGSKMSSFFSLSRPSASHGTCTFPRISLRLPTPARKLLSLLG